MSKGILIQTSLEFSAKIMKMEFGKYQHFRDTSQKQITCNNARCF